MTGIWFAALGGMMLVTYSVRLLPFLVPTMDNLPPTVRRGLRYVPPAALGALIFPDALTASAGGTAGVAISLGALLIAGIAYRFRPGIITPVLSAVVFVAVVLGLAGGGI